MLHDALMHHLASVIDRSLVVDTFACIPGRGTLAAVHRAQVHVRRHPWYAKIDIASYFASIEHLRLLVDLHRRFKDSGVLLLCQRIIDQYHATPGRGLPIGAFMSQYFANLYLAGLDRLVLESLHARAMVRYMDDYAWWAGYRIIARQQIDQVAAYLHEHRGLEIKPMWQVGPSAHGLRLCGGRVLPHALRLSQHRRRRYRHARNCRATNRNWNDPADRNENLGFRLSRAQAWSGWTAPDPTVVPSSPPLGGRGECRGRRCASRAAVPNAHRRPPLPGGAS